jgi:hypothetical protein
VIQCAVAHVVVCNLAANPAVVQLHVSVGGAPQGGAEGRSLVLVGGEVVG